MGGWRGIYRTEFGRAKERGWRKAHKLRNAPSIPWEQPVCEESCREMDACVSKWSATSRTQSHATSKLSRMSVLSHHSTREVTTVYCELGCISTKDKSAWSEYARGARNQQS
ncbi:hypothetical protein Y032_0332g2779 [Ancylostoma ceylanicum]|uniref:Uncharacterized protein n=1 Tax=Ancylostoma ceylanicum TaxID=53326 RepID=A0A016RZF1_9BILA|nr:hypothetical protein Y032_0332g2779 [Ancylostoma ceylanicum]